MVPTGTAGQHGALGARGGVFGGKQGRGKTPLGGSSFGGAHVVQLGSFGALPGQGRRGGGGEGGRGGVRKGLGEPICMGCMAGQHGALRGRALWHDCQHSQTRSCAGVITPDNTPTPLRPLPVMTQVDSALWHDSTTMLPADQKLVVCNTHQTPHP